MGGPEILDDAPIMVRMLLVLLWLTPSPLPAGPADAASGKPQLGPPDVVDERWLAAAVPSDNAVDLVHASSARPAEEPNELPEGAGQTEVGRFLYNVAVGVAVAVLSTLILRAIL